MRNKKDEEAWRKLSTMARSSDPFDQELCIEGARNKYAKKLEASRLMERARPLLKESDKNGIGAASKVCFNQGWFGDRFPQKNLHDLLWACSIRREVIFEEDDVRKLKLAPGVVRSFEFAFWVVDDLMRSKAPNVANRPSNTSSKAHDDYQPVAPVQVHGAVAQPIPIVKGNGLRTPSAFPAHAVSGGLSSSFEDGRNGYEDDDYDDDDWDEDDYGAPAPSISGYVPPPLVRAAESPLRSLPPSPPPGPPNYGPPFSLPAAPPFPPPSPRSPSPAPPPSPPLPWPGSLATTAGTARLHLASSLAALQQNPNLPAPIFAVTSGLARAIGPLFLVERGTGDPSLLFTARAVLQETLGRIQTVDQGYPGVGDAMAAVSRSLGIIFGAIRDHQIAEAVPPPFPRLLAPPPPPSAPAVVPLTYGPPPPPVPPAQPSWAPAPLVEFAAPVPFVAPPYQPPIAAAPPAPAMHPTSSYTPNYNYNPPQQSYTPPTQSSGQSIPAVFSALRVRINHALRLLSQGLGHMSHFNLAGRTLSLPTVLVVFYISIFAAFTLLYGIRITTSRRARAAQSRSIPPQSLPAHPPPPTQRPPVQQPSEVTIVDQTVTVTPDCCGRLLTTIRTVRRSGSLITTQTTQCDEYRRCWLVSTVTQHAW